MPWYLDDGFTCPQLSFVSTDDESLNLDELEICS